ncbi:MAG: DUF3866 family protein [Thermoleophilaceae bacterium]
MTKLALRRGTVVSVGEPGPATRIEVDVAGEQRPAVAYVELTGSVAPGDDVVVNVAARDLGLGSGGFDVVHVNLTRGLDGEGDPGAHVMKLNYASVQHAVVPVEEGAPPRQSGDVAGKPVAVVALHGQLPCVAWQAAEDAPGKRLGYVQTWGGALPGSLSDVVRELLARELLAGHITAGAAHGGRHEAISVAGAIHAGLTGLGWDAAIVGPGPGIVGSATAFGHGGMAALESTHAALALGCRPVFVPRMSSGDPRPRHRDLSHHSATVLGLLLRPVDVAVPEELHLPGDHRSRARAVDLDGYRASGLPAHTMGRGIDQDELFFRAALAGGAVLAEGLNDVREGG